MDIVIADATKHVALVPRLTYSQKLLDQVYDQLSEALAQTRQESSDETAGVKRTVMLCIESIVAVRQKLRYIRSLSDMSDGVIDTIPTIRAASARLSSVMPSCSEILCELAVHLGSIAADSAILSGGPVEASGYGGKSWHLLNKARQSADSKLRKPRPKI